MNKMVTSITMMGRKRGMTQIFDENGKVEAVTVLEATPNVVMSLTEKNLRVAFEDTKENKIKKPQRVELKKLNISPKRYIREFRITQKDNYKPGDEIKVDVFKEGDFVDVSAISIGKGFQGGMKRWGWSGTPASHGTTSQRRVGSVGASATPSRILKGKTMPGQMGAKRVTIQNLKVLKVDLGNHIIVVKGSVVGHMNALVSIRKSIKKKPKEEKK